MIINEQDEMLDICTASGCGHTEYYGALHWLSGRTYCRRCIYEIWEKESKWKRNPKDDFVFPKYFDGVDYTKGAKQ